MWNRFPRMLKVVLHDFTVDLLFSQWKIRFKLFVFASIVDCFGKNKLKEKKSWKMGCNCFLAFYVCKNPFNFRPFPQFT